MDSWARRGAELAEFFHHCSVTAGGYFLERISERESRTKISPAIISAARVESMPCAAVALAVNIYGRDTRMIIFADPPSLEPPF